GAVGGDAGDLDGRVLLEEHGDDAAHDHRVVDYQDADLVRPGRHSSTPSDRILSTRASLLKGLMRYSLAPAARARCMPPSSLSVVTIMTRAGAKAASARSATTKSKPFISGMLQSTRTSSGGGPPARSLSRPSMPWMASATSKPSSRSVR